MLKPLHEDSTLFFHTFLPSRLLFLHALLLLLMLFLRAILLLIHRLRSHFHLLDLQLHLLLASPERFSQ